MSKVTKFREVLYNKSNKACIVDTIIHVKTNGTFYCSVPDAYVREYIAQTPELNHKFIRDAFHANTMENLKDIVRTAYKDAYSVTQTQELVISYTLNAIMSFTRKGTEIYPNGVGLSDYQWETDPFFGDIRAGSNVPAYSIHIAAQVQNCITSTRRDGYSSTKYEYAADNQLGPWGVLLNGWTGISLRGTDIKRMPYTEEAAKFFYESIHAFVSLADKFAKFFNKDPKDLMQNITNKLITNTIPLNNKEKL